MIIASTRDVKHFPSPVQQITSRRSLFPERSSNNFVSSLCLSHKSRLSMTDKAIKQFVINISRTEACSWSLKMKRVLAPEKSSRFPRRGAKLRGIILRSAIEIRARIRGCYIHVCAYVYLTTHIHLLRRKKQSVIRRRVIRAANACACSRRRRRRRRGGAATRTCDRYSARRESGAIMRSIASDLRGNRERERKRERRTKTETVNYGTRGFSQKFHDVIKRNACDENYRGESRGIIVIYVTRNAAPIAIRQ